MKNHDVCEVYGDGFTGSTWCGRFVSRSEQKAPWTIESGKQITGHGERCDICSAAETTDRRRAAAEQSGEDQTQHEVRREHAGGRGTTWCGRSVAAPTTVGAVVLRIQTGSDEGCAALPGMQGGEGCVQISPAKAVRQDRGRAATAACWQELTN